MTRSRSDAVVRSSNQQEGIYFGLKNVLHNSVRTPVAASETKRAPRIQPLPSATPGYVELLIDHDAPYPPSATNSPLVHWLNVVAGSRQHEIIPYLPMQPPEDSKPHRYEVIVYRIASQDVATVLLQDRTFQSLESLTGKRGASARFNFDRVKLLEQNPKLSSGLQRVKYVHDPFQFYASSSVTSLQQPLLSAPTTKWAFIV